MLSTTQKKKKKKKSKRGNIVAGPPRAKRPAIRAFVQAPTTRLSTAELPDWLRFERTAKATMRQTKRSQGSRRRNGVQRHHTYRTDTEYQNDSNGKVSRERDDHRSAAQGFNRGWSPPYTTVLAFSTLPRWLEFLLVITWPASKAREDAEQKTVDRNRPAATANWLNRTAAEVTESNTMRGSGPNKHQNAACISLACLLRGSQSPKPLGFDRSKNKINTHTSYQGVCGLRLRTAHQVFMRKSGFVP